MPDLYAERSLQAIVMTNAAELHQSFTYDFRDVVRRRLTASIDFMEEALLEPPETVMGENVQFPHNPLSPEGLRREESGMSSMSEEVFLGDFVDCICALMTDAGQRGETD
eukprot:2204140-Prorocentrum_lima.AAC.1